MKIRVTIIILALCICAGIACAADESVKVPAKDKDVGTETVGTVTSTAKSAVDGTAKVVETSVSDTVAAPKTAIQAVKDTANTALKGADAAMKAITGEDTQ